MKKLTTTLIQDEINRISHVISDEQGDHLLIEYGQQEYYDKLLKLRDMANIIDSGTDFTVAYK